MEKPSTDIKKVFGALLFSVGIIIFLVTLHIIVINQMGYTKSVMLTTFEVSLRIFISLFAVGFAFLLLYYLKVLIYVAKTPKWRREEEKNE